MLSSIVFLVSIVSIGMLFLLWNNIRLQQEIRNTRNSNLQLIDFQRTQLLRLQQFSHDLRGPMTAAKGYLELLAENRLKNDDDRLKCLVNVKGSVEKMRDIMVLHLEQPLTELEQTIKRHQS